MYLNPHKHNKKSRWYFTVTQALSLQVLVSLALWKFWDLSTASGFRYHPQYHLFFFFVGNQQTPPSHHRSEAPERVAPKKKNHLCGN